MIFTRYASPVNPSARFSITCAVMQSGYCCGCAASHVSDTLDPVVMPSNELVKSALDGPAASARAASRPVVLMVVVCYPLRVGRRRMASVEQYRWNCPPGVLSVAGRKAVSSDVAVAKAAYTKSYTGAHAPAVGQVLVVLKWFRPADRVTACSYVAQGEDRHWQPTRSSSFSEGKGMLLGPADHIPPAPPRGMWLRTEQIRSPSFCPKGTCSHIKHRGLGGAGSLG